MGFEWQTNEKEELWESGSQRPAGHRRRGFLISRRSFILFLLLTLPLVGLSALYTFRQVRERIAEAEEEVLEQVLVGHELLLDAAVRGDQELFVNLLSGRDEGWTAAQQRLLTRGLLFDRPGMGARLLAQRRDPAPVVKLAPDLAEAQVSFTLTYVLTPSVGLSRTVQLTHHALYRRGARRWLYSPPLAPDRFWGEERRWAGERLRVVYPARDEAVAVRLAADLDQKLVGFCRQQARACAAGWHLFLELGTAPDLLARLAARDSEEAFGGRLKLALPAPTLLGLPAAETDYPVLLESYAAFVLTDAAANLANYRCCRNLLFFRALVEQQLVDQGVRAALLSPEEQLALLDSFRPMAGIEALARRRTLSTASTGEWLLARAFVSFLLAQSTEPVVAWQRALAEEPSVTAWLRRMAPGIEVAEAWPAYALETVQAAQAAAGVALPSWPDSELLLACSRGEADEQLVVRHRPGSAVWQPAAVIGGERASLLALPGGETVLIYRYGAARGLPRAFIWQRTQAGLRPLVGAPGRQSSVLLPVAYTPASPALDPRGQYLVLLRWNREERTTGGYRLFNLACRGAGCTDTFFPGFPIWAPDGEQLLAGNGRSLWRISRAALDERAAEFSGHLPFWLDNTTYGFLSGDTLMLGSSADDHVEPIFQLEQLAALLPAGDRLPLEIVQLLATAGRPNRLLLVAQMPARAGTYLFQLERAPDAPSFQEAAPDGGEIRLLWQHAGEQSPLAYLLDEGRLLLLSTTGSMGALLRVFDLSNRRKIFETVLGAHMGTVDFTPDGDWLVLTSEHFIELVALLASGDSPARRVLFPPFAGCTSATWIQPDG